MTDAIKSLMFDCVTDVGCVLLVGEGNFSFSAPLMRKYPSLKDRLSSTSYECEAECLRKYGPEITEENINYLLKAGAKVIHGVDATSISAKISQKFDVVIFQFPHTGRKSSIKQNRYCVCMEYQFQLHVSHAEP